MLLVQWAYKFVCFCFYCFNTLYVVGSTFSIWIKQNIKFVSIHYMLLVQSSKEKLEAMHMLLVQTLPVFRWCFYFCFNTLYVVGSKSNSSKTACLSLILFQYIICCWFKEQLLKLLQLHLSFNTLYVVGSIS